MLLSEAFYSDPLHGELRFSDPVIEDLVRSPDLQRLRGIDMAGYSSAFFPGSSHDRLQHSLGVCYLLARFDAEREEQVAGLLHDVSHSAFSHCIDYVMPTGSEARQDLQDKVFANFLQGTGIPAILQNHGMNWESLVSGRFPLLERDLPELCADRLDYALRGAIHYRILSVEKARDLFRQLDCDGSQWFFRDGAGARRFAEVFLELNLRFFASSVSAIMFRTVGDCLKWALQKGYLGHADLFQTDEHVLSILRSREAEDPHLKRLWRRMNRHSRVEVDDGPTGTKVTCKSRIVDPLFRSTSGCLERLSENNRDWRAVLEELGKPKTYYLHFHD